MYFTFKYFCHKYIVIQRQGSNHQEWAVVLNSKKRKGVPKYEVIVTHISMSLAGPVDMCEGCWHIWFVVSLSSRHT